MTLPTVVDTLQIQAPAYVRKLRRRSDWGDPSDEPAQRAKVAVEKLFRTQSQPEISIYLISNDEDLRRVALGMNAGRDSLKESVPFVAFRSEELRTLGIEATQTPGDLPCGHASSLHYDMIATDDQLLTLCSKAMTCGRVAANCTTGMMKEVVQEAISEGCRTAVPSGTCSVAVCNS